MGLRWREAAHLDDVEVEGYLNSLGQRLVAAAPRWRRFQLLCGERPTLNAFALPGGFIGVHTGLVLAASTESELASVLGHEIAPCDAAAYCPHDRQPGGVPEWVMLASMIVCHPGCEQQP